MFNNMMSPSLADIAAVTGRNGNGYGMDGGWWAIVIILALCGGFGGFGGFGGGWGMNGWGMMNGFGGMNGFNTFGFLNGDIQRAFDTQTIISKLDGLNNGVCGLGYDQLAQMNGINQNIMQTGFGLQQSINQVDINAMQNANAIATQLAQCCCENRQGQADIKYAMATDTCAITNAINQMAQNIMQNDNANYRQLHDENVAIQMEAKNEKIQAQAARIQQLELLASQEAQNNYLVDTLRPCARPAYITCNPFTGVNAWNQGCNNGGCCNNVA